MPPAGDTGGSSFSAAVFRGKRAPAGRKRNLREGCRRPHRGEKQQTLLPGKRTSLTEAWHRKPAREGTSEMARLPRTRAPAANGRPLPGEGGDAPGGQASHGEKEPGFEEPESRGVEMPHRRNRRENPTWERVCRREGASRPSRRAHETHPQSRRRRAEDEQKPPGRLVFPRETQKRREADLHHHPESRAETGASASPWASGSQRPGRKSPPFSTSPPIQEHDRRQGCPGKGASGKTSRMPVHFETAQE
jgi:hypothetical protein